jgi:O-antigen/teichoic acid export membrane protein
MGGVASSIASRGIAAISPLLLVPLTLGYLGAELYGLWVSILALTSMALWADLGLGNGLLTRLTPVLTTGDRPAAQRLVSTGYAGLFVVSSVAIVALALLSWSLPWQSILSIDSQAAASKAPAMALITIGGFLLNIPLSLIQRVQYSNQQVSQSNMWQAGGSLASVAAAWAAVQAGLGIYWVVGAVAAGPLLGNVVNSAWFYRRNSDLLPRLRLADRHSARSMFGLGSQFFLMSVMSSIALNADNLVIAHTLGLKAVAAYSVPYRALTALGLLVTLINLPLWPANGEALAQGDTKWVRHITGRMTFLSAVAVLVPGAIIVIASDPIFRLWLGAEHPPPSHSLVALLTLWWVCTAAAAPRFMVQNATGLVRPQVRGWTVFFVVSLPLKFIGAQQFGLNGVVAAAIAAYLVTMWPAAIIGYRDAINSAGTKAEEQRP